MKKSEKIVIVMILVMLMSFVLASCNKDIDYTIYFNVDGEIYATVSTKGQETIAIPGNPSKDDHIFDGWYWDEGIWERPFTFNSLLDTPISSDMTVYAKWVSEEDLSQTFCITFNSMGGGAVGEITAAYNSVIAQPGNPFRSGYVFVGWFKEADYSTRWNFSSDKVLTNITLYAKWAPEQVNPGKYTVTFVTNCDALAASLEVSSGSMITAPSVTNEGFALEGWYTSLDGGDTLDEKWSFVNDKVNANLTLYAKWTSATQGLRYTLINNDTQYEVSGIGTATQTEIAIPAVYDGKPVKSIGYAAFIFCSGLTSITIPDSVTSIGEDAFSYCSGLTSITIPDSVTSIGGSAFYDCSELTSITIPDSVTSIGSYAFSGCSELTGVYISDIAAWCGISFSDSYSNPLYYAKNLYLDGELLSGVLTIPDGVTQILSYAFYNCSELTSIIIPDSVTSIGGSAFYGCSGLTSITIPFVGSTLDGTSNTRFGCIFGSVPSSLKTVIITGGSSIDSDAFYNCSGLTSVTIPDSVVSIDGNAFYGCTGLTSITIPDSVTSIGSYAFYDCSSLTSITIGNGVTSIGSSAFLDCSALTAVHISDIAAWCGISYQYYSSNPLYSAKNLYLDGELLSGALTIPDGVTQIPSYAFYNCSELNSIIIPDSVTSIDGAAFLGCSGLISITIPFVGNTLNGTSDTRLGYIFYSIPSSLKTVIITGSSSIGNDAFKDCSGLTSITIPDSVTSIGDSAFSGCSGLTSVAIPHSVTSIGSGAFRACNGLTSITISDSVTSIGESAFSGCSGLTSITIPDSVTSIDRAAFLGCSGLISITIPFVGNTLNGTSNTYWGYIFGARYDSDNSSYVPTSLKTVIITGSSSIGDDAFADCSGLTSITIPDSVTSIGSRAFYNCSGLTAVYISDIAAWCGISFGNSYSNPLCYAENLYSDGVLVADLVIPDSVTSIGSSAFSGCSGLASITIPDSVTSIGSYAFSGCSELSSVSIPDSVTSIGSGAFSGCSGLTSITLPFVGATKDRTSNTHFGYVFGASSYSYNYSYIPSNLRTVVITDGTSIDDSAFYHCSGLTSVTISSGVTIIGSSAFDDCGGLTSITIPDSVTAIGSYAFEDCSGLTSITIPDSVTAIRDGAFYKCSHLTSITIPDSVTSIGEKAFSYCKGLTSVTIGSGVTSIGNYAFDDCGGLTKVNITSIEAWCKISFGNGYSTPLHYTKNLHLNDELITELAIPDSVTSISNYLFSGCSGLTSITIGGSVTSISSYAFYNCSGLTSISIPDSVTSIGEYAFDNTPWYNNQPDGVIYAGKVLYKYKGSMPDYGTSITVKDGTKSITALAFKNHAALGYVTIPYGVISIGSGAFYGCKYLNSITIPNSVTSIGSEAFYDCWYLRSITIPDSVTSIGKGAFHSTKWYNDRPDGVIYTGKVFYEYKGFMSANTSITVYNGTKVIADGAFYGCSGLTSITIPDSVTSIGYEAFRFCSGLTSVTIPDSVTSIGDYAFYECYGLTSITIPDSVTSIGYEAFRGCSGLTSITLPFVGNTLDGTSNTHFWYIFGIGSYPGDSSYVPASLKTVIITGGSSIGSSAFEDCVGLTSITIPDSITSIGDFAFLDCSGLASITFADTAGWYRTASQSNWQAKTGGTLTSVTNATTNATYFTSTYNNHYWYKL